jgi:hypothetical protein
MPVDSISVLALAVSSFSLAISSRQLNLNRSAAGGRAAHFIAGRTGNIAQPPRFERGRLVEIPRYRVRFEVGGTAVYHQVAVFLVGIDPGENGEPPPVPPAPRTTMGTGDDPIVWEFELPDNESAANAYAVATWRLPYLEGVRSEAVARWLDSDYAYHLHIYSRPWRTVRRLVRNWARRHQRLSWRQLRDLRIHGRWKRRKPSNALDIEGAFGPPPRPPRK